MSDHLGGVYNSSNYWFEVYREALEHSMIKEILFDA